MTPPHLSGFLLIDKPIGLSSNQVLNRIKRHFRGKIGHTGTLDPFASGMLVTALGEATKFSSHGLKAGKTYRTTIQLGSVTDTDDLTGQTLESQPVPSDLTLTTIKQVLKDKFTGKIQQVPPQYAANKYKGRPYYYYARRGIDVPQKIRTVFIESTHDINYDPQKQQIYLTVSCGSGTYIRSLARDLALALGTLGHCCALRRLWVNPWKETDLIKIEDIESIQTIKNALQPIDSGLTIIHHLSCTPIQIQALQQGQFIPIEVLHSDNLPSSTSETVSIFGPNCTFFGLATIDEGFLKPKKICQYPT